MLSQLPASVVKAHGPNGSEPRPDPAVANELWGFIVAAPPAYSQPFAALGADHPSGLRFLSNVRDAGDLSDDIKTFHPKLVLLSPEVRGYTPDLVSQLANCPDRTLAVVGLVPESDRQIAESMLAKGAMAVYTTPVTPELVHGFVHEAPSLVARVQELRRPRSPSRVQPARPAQVPTQTKTVGVWSMKGGDGKTLVTVNVACLLAVVGGQRVLIIDADMNGGRAALHLNVAPEENTLFYLAADYKAAGNALDEKMLRHRLVTVEDVFDLPGKRGEGRLDLLCGITDVAHSTSAELAGEQGQHCLTSALRQARELYDFVLVDTGSHPLLGPHAGVLQEADAILLLNSTDRTSLIPNRAMLKSLMKRFRLAPDRFLLVINRYSERDRINLLDVRDYMGLEVRAVVPEDTSRSVVSLLNGGEPFVLAHLKAREKDPAASKTWEGLVNVAEEIYPPIRKAIDERIGAKGWWPFGR